MAVNLLYSVATILGICFIGAALALELLYIKNDQNTDEYLPHQIAAIVMDTVLVGYLLSFLMYYRPYNDAVQTGVVTMMLIIGLGLEIFLTQMEITPSITYSSYIIASFNALFRLYVFIQMRCNSPLTSIPALIKGIVNTSQNTGTSVSETLKAVAVPLGGIDIDNAYRSSMNIINDILNKSQLLPEQRIASRNKLKEVFGKSEQKQPVEVDGGRRR